MSRKKNRYPPWKLRFWCLFVGQGLSLVGSAMTQFVLLWWITDMTGSVSALGVAGLAILLPQALLGPLGGAFADRYSRRCLMILADLISAACMAVLILLLLSGNAMPWHVYVMMAVRSAMQAFQEPAAAASTAMLVPRNFLSRAAGLYQTLDGVMTVGAAPLGALAISLMPIGLALAVDLVTAVLGILPLLVFPIPRPRAAGSGRSSLRQELLEGVDVVWKDPALRQLYGLLSAAVLVIMPTFTLVPLLVKAHFGGSSAQVAQIESLGGIGMVLGGLCVAVVAPRRRIPWVLWGFALSCFALALTALPSGGMFWLGVVGWVVSSMTYAMGNAPLMTLLQTRVPKELQGRALSLLSTLEGLAAPLGLAIATPIGEVLGVRWLFVLLGTAGGVVMLLGFLSPGIRRIDERCGGCEAPRGNPHPSLSRWWETGEFEG